MPLAQVSLVFLLYFTKEDVSVLHYYKGSVWQAGEVHSCGTGSDTKSGADIVINLLSLLYEHEMQVCTDNKSRVVLGPVLCRRPFPFPSFNQCLFILLTAMVRVRAEVRLWLAVLYRIWLRLR